MGDDIILFNESLAREYQDLCKEIGLTISESKSITPSTLPGTSLARDFLSKLTVGRAELSRLYFKVLSERGGGSLFIAELITRYVALSRPLPLRTLQRLMSIYDTS